MSNQVGHRLVKFCLIDQISLLDSVVKLNVHGRRMTGN